MPTPAHAPGWAPGAGGRARKVRAAGQQGGGAQGWAQGPGPCPQRYGLCWCSLGHWGRAAWGEVWATGTQALLRVGPAATGQA